MLQPERVKLKKHLLYDETGSIRDGLKGVLQHAGRRIIRRWLGLEFL